mmetsp:Transcript_109302/g.296429  ORF Transcript_109302/g.296429 Transcript_109302/m.296429 type:complete len:228 (+) Transcript_109302:29-712(+)
MCSSALALIAQVLPSMPQFQGQTNPTYSTAGSLSNAQFFPAVLQPLEYPLGLSILADVLVRMPLHHQFLRAPSLLLLRCVSESLQAGLQFCQRGGLAWRRVAAGGRRRAEARVRGAPRLRPRRGALGRPRLRAPRLRRLRPSPLGAPAGGAGCPVRAAAGARVRSFRVRRRGAAAWPPGAAAGRRRGPRAGNAVEAAGPVARMARRPGLRPRTLRAAALLSEIGVRS